MKKNMRTVLVIAALVCLGGHARAQTAEYGHHGAALLPDDKVTPGVVALTDTQKVCSIKWGDEARAVTKAMREQVYAAYGATPNQGICKPIPHKNKKGQTIIPKSGCELDHRLSKELGGADDKKNLWVQPYLTPEDPGAYQKDKLENWLHVQVCRGKMTLADAQKALLGDWYWAYLQMEKQAGH